MVFPFRNASGNAISGSFQRLQRPCAVNMDSTVMDICEYMDSTDMDICEQCLYFIGHYENISSG